jgi:biopolymer transport protein ExbB/TolQ
VNIFPALQAVLYAISTALLYPVVLLLILLSLWMLIYAGGFLAEWIKRRQYRANGHLSDSLEIIQQKHQLPVAIGKNLPAHISQYAKDLADIVQSPSSFLAERVEDLNQRKEYSLVREVDKIRLIVRIGPSLGLMGTLIPMSTGLAGLNQGNMAQLSASLILAFATTVVGLALGIAALLFSVAKQRWVNEDLRLIGLITEAMTRKVEH